MAGLAQFQGRYSTNQPLVLAGALVSIAPVVLLYLSGQRFFVRGLTAGIGKYATGVECREHGAALPHAGLGDRVEHEDRLVGACLGEVVQERGRSAAGRP